MNEPTNEQIINNYISLLYLNFKFHIDILLIACTAILIIFNLSMSLVVWSKSDTDMSNYSYFMQYAVLMCHMS